MPCPDNIHSTFRPNFGRSLRSSGDGLAVLANAAPLESHAINEFQVTNFVYGCTTTCDWSFNVSILGDGTKNNPAVSTPVTCSGSLTDKDYVTCGSVSDTQTISAYIKKSNNQLLLQCQVEKPKQVARYNYYGHTHVNAETSGIAQPKKFQVKLSRSTGVA